jgi:hypothetical protein
MLATHGFNDNKTNLTTEYTNGGASQWRANKYPRMLADVDGDGKADIVGFAEDSVAVRLNSGESFESLSAYGDATWDMVKNPRHVVDVNGDGLADIVGFGNNGVQVSLSTGTKFEAPSLWLPGGFIDGEVNVGTFPFYPKARAYYKRELADANGDGLVDIIGFHLDGVRVSLSTGKEFLPPVTWIDKYGLRTGESYVTSRFRNETDDDGNIISTTKIHGWHEYNPPRILSDMDGDGRVDIVGFVDNQIYVSLARDNTFTEPAVWHEDFGYETTPPVLASEEFHDNHPRMIADINDDGSS